MKRAGRVTWRGVVMIAAIAAIAAVSAPRGTRACCAMWPMLVSCTLAAPRRWRLRVVLSGYAGEHDALESRGWRVVEWKTKGGYSTGENANQKRERLWLSPACLDATKQPSLFGGAA